MPSSKQEGFVEGVVVADEIAFDEDELIFVDDFMFLAADFIKYKELEDIIEDGQFNGVVGFNRFGFKQ